MELRWDNWVHLGFMSIVGSLIVCPSPRVPLCWIAMLTTYVFFISFVGFIDEIQDIFVVAWHLKWELLVSLSPFFLVLVAFVAFVCWNGSIVLGNICLHF